MRQLATRADFEKAKSLVLRHLQENGVTQRRTLSAYRHWGVTYEAIELALRDLTYKGICEELYSLPPTDKRGTRPTYYALTVSLDSGIELPEGAIRQQDALALVGEE